VDEWQAPLAGWAEKTITPGGFTTREAIVGAGLRLRESITRTDEMAAAASLRRAGFQRQTNQTRRPDGKRERFWQLAQPAQPGSTCLAEVESAESPSPAAGLPTLTQPTQPFQEIFKRERDGVTHKGEGMPSLSPIDMANVVEPVESAAETPSPAGDLGRLNLPTQPLRLCQPEGLLTVTERVVLAQEGGADGVDAIAAWLQRSGMGITARVVLHEKPVITMVFDFLEDLFKPMSDRR
jgi:hypothetical protein